MNSQISQKVQDLLSSGYELKLGEYISRGWKILTSNAGTFIIFTLLYLIIAMVLGFIPIIGQLASSLVVTPALTAGFFLLAKDQDDDGAATISRGFDGFKLLGKLVPLALLQAIVIIISMLPFILLAGGPSLISWFMEIQGNPAAAAEMGLPSVPGWSFLLLILPVYLSVSYMWSYLFVVFHDMGAWDAMEASRKLITKKWFLFFVFMFVLGFLAGLGVLALFVGMLFTIPLVYTSLYASFDDIVGTGGDLEEDTELDHLIA